MISRETRPDVKVINSYFGGDVVRDESSMMSETTESRQRDKKQFKNEASTSFPSNVRANATIYTRR